MHRKPSCLVLDIEPYRYQQFISDLNGVDPQAHDGNVETTVTLVRNWLANVTRRKIAGPVVIVEAYRLFEIDRPRIAEAAGFDPRAIPYLDFIDIAAAWLLDAPAK